MKIIILRFPYAHEKFFGVACLMARRLGCEVSGVVTFDLNEKETSCEGYPLYPLNEIKNLSWDVAIYCCEDDDFAEILPRMIELGIGTREQFKNVFWLLQQFMIKKYEDCADPAIQETLEWWKTHELSVFNQYVPEGLLDETFFDETCGLAYVNYETVGGELRKMYFKTSKTAADFKNGQNFIRSFSREQIPTSPHLYVTGEHQVRPGDVIIDAGVAEGNFAIKYVDICSKMYLFEPEEDWQEPLRKTFKNYRDKVEIIPCFVSDVTDDKNVTIDDALPDLRSKNIFLKMDVEGAEPRALLGAKKLLTNNKVRASVCTYHNADDLVKVKSILQSFGYKTSTSAGYMIFIYDPKIFKTADFRKGIVYAEN